jgi:hypothetical protein
MNEARIEPAWLSNDHGQQFWLYIALWSSQLQGNRISELPVLESGAPELEYRFKSVSCK